VYCEKTAAFFTFAYPVTEVWPICKTLPGD